MKFENLDGYRIGHIADDMHTVLKERRQILGLTQQQVADRAKIKITQYQRFEMGERNIMRASFRIACSIVEALEMDITKFFHCNYVIGEEIFIDKEGPKYKKTGRLVSEDIV